MAERVEDAAEQLRAGARQRRAVRGGDFAADVQAGGVAQQHEQHAVLAEADHLGADGELGARRAHEAEFAEADVGALGLDDEARDARDRADALHRRQVADLRAEHIDERSDGDVHAPVREWVSAASLVSWRASVRPKRERTRQSPGFRVASMRTRRPG